MTTTATRTPARTISRALLVCGIPWVTACSPAASQSPMHPATSLEYGEVAPSAAAHVVFLRAASACDGGAPFRIVDDKLRFVGESAPATKFATDVVPGHHAFFAWQPFGDVPKGKYPEADQVGAVETDFEPARTYYVDVSIANKPFGTGKSCYRYQWVKLRFVEPATDQDTAKALADAQATAPDAGDGQRAVEADRAEVERHVALGMRKLRKRESAAGGEGGADR